MAIDVNLNPRLHTLMYVTLAPASSELVADIAAESDYKDFLLEVRGDVTLDKILAARDNSWARFFAFFLRLAELSQEDERLSSLLDDYEIEIWHGLAGEPDRERLYPTVTYKP